MREGEGEWGQRQNRGGEKVEQRGADSHLRITVSAVAGD